MKNGKIKKAVIREDLLSITKDFKEAVILNQFIYWSERVSDADVLIKKENEIAQKNGEEEREPLYGWIYKTAEELSEEVMLGLSASQIRRYISNLVDYGYIVKRNNPKYKWDRTLQYKVNLVNIARALKKNGYPLSEYKIDIPDCEPPIAHGRAINEANMENQSRSDERAIPEITPENTNKDYEYAFSKEKDFNMYTSFPEGESTSTNNNKKKSRYIPEDYTERQLIYHIIPVVKDEMEKNLSGDKYPPVNEFLEVTRHFYGKYAEATGKRHRILSDESYRETVRRFLNPPENMTYEEDDIFDPGMYKEMIDKYFMIDFNRHGKYAGKIDRSLSHFMSDRIREYIYDRVYIYAGSEVDEDEE